MTDGVAVTKRNIGGVIRPQAGTTDSDAMTIALAKCEIEHVHVLAVISSEAEVEKSLL